MLRILILLAVLPLTVLAQSGLIRGKVRVPGGATLTGVIVELWKTGSFETQTVTTRDGDFEFPNLIPSNYEVVVKHQGFHPAAQRVEFYFEQNNARLEIRSVEIMLRPVEQPANRMPPGTTFVQEVPDAARTAFDRAMAKMRDGKHDEAVTLLDKAVSVFPDYFDAHFALAVEHDRRGRAEAALGALEHARRINDRDARVYYIFGVIMSRNRKYITAEYAFRNALDRNPTHAPTSFALGVVQIELARRSSNEAEKKELIELAERSLTRAIESSEPKIAAAYMQRARLRELRGDKSAAADDLAAYLKLNPDEKNAAAIRAAIEKLRAN